MSEELDHVLRLPLPWREMHMTECGRDPSGLNVLTNEEFVARCKDYGQQRTALVTCMTCLSTVQRWIRADSLTAQVGREVNRVGDYRWSKSTKDDGRLENELRAIQLLVAEHREEFDAALAAMSDATSLDQARTTRDAKRRYRQR